MNSPFPLNDEVLLVIVDEPGVCRRIGGGRYYHDAKVNGHAVSIYSDSPEPPSGFCKVRRGKGFTYLYWLVEQL